jgi:hypothetical protein
MSPPRLPVRNSGDRCRRALFYFFLFHPDLLPDNLVELIAAVIDPDRPHVGDYAEGDDDQYVAPVGQSIPVAGPSSPKSATSVGSTSAGKTHRPVLICPRPSDVLMAHRTARNTATNPLNAAAWSPIGRWGLPFLHLEHPTAADRDKDPHQGPHQREGATEVLR